MNIETMTAGRTVSVTASDETIEVRLGDPGEGAGAATLSMPQAEMLLHALGFAIAQIEEAQRRAAAQRRHLAEVVADTEIRRR